MHPHRTWCKQVTSPPYNMLNSAEAGEGAKGNEKSYCGITKPEIDLREQQT